MTKYLIIILLSFPFTLLSQQGVSIYANYNPSVLVLYTNNYKDYIDAGNKIKLTNYDIGVNSQIYRDQNITIKLGVRYKDMRLHLRYYEDTLIVYEYITSSKEYSYISQDSYHYVDTIQNKVSSNSVGLNLDISYHFGKNKQHDIGLISNYYFFEDYKSIFSSKKLGLMRNASVGKPALGEPYQMTDDSYMKFVRIAKWDEILYRKFFTSAVDLQLYYQYNLNFSKNFSLGFRASIGTNLYSDWNQFKKYVWVGFGVNFGFLSNEKVRLNKKMPLGEVEKKESM